MDKLDELTAHIKATLPQSQPLTQLKPDAGGGYVTFQWNGSNFVVRTNFESFELRNRQLMVTGASVLMQAALSTKNRHHKVLESVIGLLYQAEDLISSKHQKEEGLRLLSNVKNTIAKLAAH